MNLSDIISIGGMGGLFKIVAQIKNGVLVESLIDKKRIPAYATHKVSELESITIYTEDDDMPLADVFQKIYDTEKGGECLSHKSGNDELKAYFKKALPNFDEDRVYVSDIKKVLQWYNILQKNGLLETKKEEKKESAEGDKKAKTKAKAAKKAPKKTNTKANNQKAGKTAGAKVKVQTVRKTGG